MTSHIAPGPVVTLLRHTNYIGKKFEKKDGQLIKSNRPVGTACRIGL